MTRGCLSPSVVKSVRGAGATGHHARADLADAASEESRPPGLWPARRSSPPDKEVKFVGAALAVVDQTGVFEGYASLFDIVDLGRDMVARGAFVESLARRGLRGVKLLWQHNPAAVIGTWDDIREDSKGLRVRGRLDMAVARAREVYALMKSGAVDGLSIGFRTEKGRRDPITGIRKLERIDLWEVSVVTFPMLPGARISACKNATAYQNHLPACFPCRPLLTAADRDRALAQALRRGAISMRNERTTR
jgi:hypothetical protein